MRFEGGGIFIDSITVYDFNVEFEFSILRIENEAFEFSILQSEEVIEVRIERDAIPPKPKVIKPPINVKEDEVYKVLHQRPTWTLHEVLEAFKQYDPESVIKLVETIGARPWKTLVVFPNHPNKRRERK